MALVLTVRHGEKLFIDNDCLTVIEVSATERKSKIQIRNKIFDLDDQNSVEILPNVFSFIGNSDDSVCRIGFDAPRSVKILRESLYRQKK
ncbi:MAG: hypothetical protein DI586_11425 [Micavibrio aeruginosavorus]|uniref:Carbon storage regulator n=1 Tax=Micavibrio aeruginosavorus TaxID=349221 RepID=A0A2W5FFK6_9BACT|nr:MAG: hypothetical protein DI586_11425 [Micavibrio aeruginosavorus]